MSKIRSPRIRVFTAGGDTSKRWFVELITYLPRTRFQYYDGINKTSDQRKRMQKIKEIERVLKQLLSEGWIPKKHLTGHFVDQSKVLLKDAVRRALREKALTIKQTTFEAYRDAVTQFIKFVDSEGLSDLKITNFAKLHAQAYQRYLMERKLSNTTRNSYIKQIGNVFTILVDEETLNRNPFRNLKILREEIRKHAAFSQAHLNLIMAHIKEKAPEMELFCKLQYYCFIRPIEITRLRFKNLHLDRGLIYLDSSITKNGKEAWVLIPEQFLLELRETYSSGLLDENLYLFSVDENMRIKPGPKQMDRRVFSKKFARILKTLKLQGREYTLYSFKHTGVSRLVQAGVNLFEVKSHLRHAKIETMMNYVRSLGNTAGEEVSKKFPSIL